MQSVYPPRFERDVGCSATEWVAWMPRAIGGHSWQRDGDRITVQIGQGQLVMSWEALPERRIALLRLQRLKVVFEFLGLDEAQRLAFMRPFDLSIQRGGG
jgi:hypothetical protein